jgi:hypothetical protein
MKNLLVLAILVSANVMAGDRVILSDSKEMSVEINESNVFCSGIGYGVNEELKVNIPGLDGWTILDHTNVRFGDNRNLPCMTAGFCKSSMRPDGISIDAILQNNPRVEKILVHRQVIENRTFNTDDQVCYKTLIEKLDTKINGIAFSHKRSINAERLPEVACKF